MELRMAEIKIGDVVKKTVGTEAWVLVIDKEQLIYRDTGKSFNRYTVLKPDGSKGVYTEDALHKRADIYV